MSDGESGEGQGASKGGILGRLKQKEKQARADLISNYADRYKAAAEAAKWRFRRTVPPSEQLGEEPIVIKRK